MKFPRVVKANHKVTNKNRQVMIEHRFGQQSGQHDSYGRNAAARVRLFGGFSKTNEQHISTKTQDL